MKKTVKRMPGKNSSIKQTIKSYAIITLGSVILSLAFDAFYAPNQMAMGGITGIAQVINALFPAITVGVATLALNIPLFIAGWRLIGFHLLASSLFSMAVSSVAIDAIALLYSFPPVDPMLAALYGGALTGLGVGIVFTQGATTGGADVAGRLMKLKFTWLPMGKLVLVADFAGLAVAALAFGRLESALYGVVATVVSSWVMDTVLYGLDTSKVAYVITDRWAETAELLMKDLDRGVTFLHGEGAYTGAEKRVLLVAFKQKEIVEIKRVVHDVDPGAFLIVCDAHDVLGEGFGEYQKEDL